MLRQSLHCGYRQAALNATTALRASAAAATRRRGFSRPAAGDHRLLQRSTTKKGADIPNYVYVLGGGATLLIGIGYVSYLDKVPISGRRRWVAVSPSFESKLGHEEYRNLLQEYEKDILPSNHPASITLHRVGKRIAESSVQFATKHDVRAYLQVYAASPFTFTVVRADDVANAFVLPGNHVFLFTGLFQFVHNEDDLAAVLGHEVAHNVARHAAEKLSGAFITNLLAFATLLFDPSGVLLKVFYPAAAIFRQLPNSRTQEIEADRIGLLISADACYDPHAAKQLFVAMNHQHGEMSPPEFLSTHPSNDTRIAKFDDWIPEAQAAVTEPDRCRKVREQMAAARRAAAAARWQQQQQQQHHPQRRQQ
jgi:metalloendopeptidase OMA1, mitochondrial